MSENEAVLSAVAAVEEGGAALEGEALDSENLDPNSDPSAVLSEQEADPTPDAEQGGGVFGIDVGEWALSVPEGSHRDFDARDWWDPQGGGENRLAFHLSALSDEGAGYPNLPGALVGLAELYYRRVVGGGLEADPDGEPEPDPDGEPQTTATRQEADALV